MTDLAPRVIARQRGIRTTLSARERAYEAIRDAVIRTEFAPGTRLSENELAERFEVSRQPIREALLLLAEERLVEVRPQSGTYVSLIDPGEVEQAQFVREVIELGSLERARPMTESDIAAFDDVIARQRGAGSLEEFYPLDEEFHRLLMGLSGHATAWATVTRFKSHLDRARYLGFVSNRTLADYADDHERIFTALRDGRPGDARDELRTHLRQILGDIGGVREKTPELFG